MLPHKSANVLKIEAITAYIHVHVHVHVCVMYKLYMCSV